MLVGAACRCVLQSFPCCSNIILTCTKCIRHENSASGLGLLKSCQVIAEVNNYEKNLGRAVNSAACEKVLICKRSGAMPESFAVHKTCQPIQLVLIVRPDPAGTDAWTGQALQQLQKLTQPCKGNIPCGHLVK